MTGLSIDMNRLLGFRLARACAGAARSQASPPARTPARTPALRLMGSAAMVGGKTCIRFLAARKDG